MKSEYKIQKTYVKKIETFNGVDFGKVKAYTIVYDNIDDYLIGEHTAYSDELNGKVERITIKGCGYVLWAYIKVYRWWK